MEVSNGSVLAVLVLMLLLRMRGLGLVLGEPGHLSYDFYEQSCPQLESIVKWEAARIFLEQPEVPSAFLRLLFHDCQVQGCDASILLETSPNTTSEMGSHKNFGIRDREVLGKIKSTVEAECPGTVSCADILVLSAREAVASSGGPTIRVPLGRRDALSTSGELADASLPPATAPVEAMLRIFAEKGMTVEESVAIMGAHTLGVAHCVSVESSLGEGGVAQAPGRAAGFESILRESCLGSGADPGKTYLPNDFTLFSFDNQYYRELVAGRGLLRVDVEIAAHPRTAALVRRYAVDLAGFFQAFASAFELAAGDRRNPALATTCRDCRFRPTIADLKKKRFILT
ncbi:hypothetical protein Taro_035102 [Colocasia esculenta]|uniref:Peroxidase n=1 Tax=Colocasia esculenta TaxID=4460 RepID=A0A843WDW0_COLES|nr:hypothetical protein [Colocasia esculenta]